jgi:death-on-curing protein
LDGNKRTGFLAGVLFLEMNGYRFTATQEAAATMVLGLAAGTLDEMEFTTWVRANVERGGNWRRLDFSASLSTLHHAVCSA